MAFSNEQDDDAVMSEINMTPLVDVMLVLLIIFMITVPVLTQSVEIDLPRAAPSASDTKPDSITLSVDVSGTIFWDQEVIDLAALKTRLTQIAAQQPQTAVHIRGDKKTEYQHVIQLLTSAQDAGLTRLGFITEPKP